MNPISIIYYAISINLFIAAISLSITIHNFNSILKSFGYKSSNYSSIKYILGQAAKCLIPFYNIYILISEIGILAARKFIKE